MVARYSHHEELAIAERRESCVLSSVPGARIRGRLRGLRGPIFAVTLERLARPSGRSSIRAMTVAVHPWLVSLPSPLPSFFCVSLALQNATQENDISPLFTSAHEAPHNAAPSGLLEKCDVPEDRIRPSMVALTPMRTSFSPHCEGPRLPSLGDRRSPSASASAARIRSSPIW